MLTTGDSLDALPRFLPMLLAFVQNIHGRLSHIALSAQSLSRSLYYNRDLIEAVQRTSLHNEVIYAMRNTKREMSSVRSAKDLAKICEKLIQATESPPTTTGGAPTVTKVINPDEFFRLTKELEQQYQTRAMESFFKFIFGFLGFFRFSPVFRNLGFLNTFFRPTLFNYKKC